MGLLFVCTSALAYPDRPVKLIVPFPGGSQTDLVARMVAQQLTAQLGGAFVVENRPGAVGTIAATQVARATPDGYTLLVTSAGVQAMNYSLFKELPYKPADFAAIGRVASTGMVLMVKSDSPIKSVSDLVQAAEANRGKLSAGYGSPGSQIALASFKSLAKIDVLDIPYKGIPNAVTDMLGGQIDFTFVDFGTALAQAKGGALRALAVTPAGGSSLMPEVSALAKFYPDYSTSSWYGVMAPADTPKKILELLSAALARSMQDPSLVPGLAALGVEPAFMDAAQFQQYIDKEITSWAEMIKLANIQKQ
ncbi:tripartite tricarboxylate transporter substrate binding protein [Achromobacter spanius]|uniref:tripartite tricarboxylate transporter substrate binding protein n=1 Tax=Achromobacter spanius TaxID=217203 RepID=UPI0036E09735